MDDKQQDSTVDKATHKAQDALGKFMDDPEKVAKAKTKAEGFLSKYVGDDEANQVVNELEGLLGTFAHHPDSENHE